MELHDFEKKNRKKKPNDEIKRLRWEVKHFQLLMTKESDRN
jgi:hypothetical protein